MMDFFYGDLVELVEMKAFIDWPLWLNGNYVNAIN